MEPEDLTFQLRRLQEEAQTNPELPPGFGRGMLPDGQRARDLDEKQAEIEACRRTNSNLTWEVAKLKRELSAVRYDLDAAKDDLAEAREELEIANDYAADLLGESEREEEVIHETTITLDRAKDLVCGDRANHYGDPRVRYAQIAKMWEGYLQLPEGSIDARDAVQMLICMKQVRDRHHRKPDNPDDQAGYAQLLSWIGDPRQQ